MNRWTLASHVGALHVGAARAKIVLERPELGLQEFFVETVAIQGQLLSLASGDNDRHWPARLVEAYVRAGDLVASYAGTDSWPYAPQVYWTAEELEAAGRQFAALSLVVSIQTHLLDTHPRIAVQSHLRCAEVLLVSVVGDEMLVDSHGDGVQSLDPRANACALVWRLPECELSYVEVMPTSDFRQLAIERSGDTIGSRWELFAEFLEKGVIRRARLQSMFVPREDDVQIAAECCQAIERRPLPLTT